MDDQLLSIDTTGISIDDLEVKSESACVAVVQDSKTCTPVTRTLSKSGFDISRMLTFDVETGPDLFRLPLFNLEPVEEPKPITPFVDCPPVDEFLIQYGTVSKLEKALAKLRPCSEWTAKLREAEESSEKSRSTALAAIKSYQNKISDEISAVTGRLKLLQTNPYYAMITSIAWAVGDETIQCRIASHGDYERDCSERDLLQLFWDLVAECSPLVGFNIVDFDLRLICIRSAILGVKPSRMIDMSQYRNDCIDMFVRLGKKGRCKDISRDLGISVPAGDMDGSQAWMLYMQSPEDLRRYNISDVHIEREMFFLLSGCLWI